MLANRSRQILVGAAVFCILLFARQVFSDTYTNPLSEIHPEEGYGDDIADTCVIKWMGEYYLYPTSSGPHLFCWRSQDIVGSSNSGGKYSIVPEEPETWGMGPQLFYYDGTFYMYVTQVSWPFHHSLHSADMPLGTFELVDDEFFTGIGGSVFMDKDSSMQMRFFHENINDGIRCQPLDSPTEVATSGPPYPRTYHDLKVDLGSYPEAQWTEGAFAFMVGNEYYVTYVGPNFADFRYQVHAGRATYDPQQGLGFEDLAP
ncbi:family 43 glycosylhydrolase [Candidatus Sumerlaeota bacterium]|nr:family 43 glycosylhydrolase [Candidatus Sumerlaeota bacterium]